MKTIWKFELTIDGKQTISIPAGATILTIQIQNGIPCLWALVDPSTEEKEHRVIQIIGTGHPIKENDFWRSYKYISTFQFMNGALVLHAFEKMSNK